MLSYRAPDIVGFGIPIVNIGKLVTMANRHRTPFGARMHQARARAKKTQVEVARLLAISQGTLSELETEAAGSARVAEFAALYGCNAVWLATGEGAPQWATPGEPPPPGQKFKDRHVATPSEWALLNDIKDAMTLPKYAAQIAEIREEMAAIRAMTKREIESRIAAATKKGKA